MKDRLGYLLLIACFLGLLSSEYKYFADHYRSLEKQLDYVMAHCK